jgi:hypothetical protein
VIFNFVVLSDYENILTTKFSGFTVYHTVQVPRNLVLLMVLVVVTVVL